MTNIPDKETEKMVNLGRLTRGILHDLNNSLASIMGFADFLTDDLDPSSEQYVFAQNIKKAGLQIENLVEQIRAVSIERGTGKNISINLVDIIKGLTDDIQKNLKPQQQIIFLTNIQAATLSLPSFQFKVMFANLLKNAIQSLSDNSGTIMVHISSANQINQNDLKGDYHFISHLCDAHQVIDKKILRIDVIDTGCGMDEVTLNLAPAPHFTTKSADIAHGLGLTISSQIIHSLDGGLSISTTPNIGSRVTIALPVEKITL